MAAAVIQRCYRKYKQVSPFSPESSPPPLSAQSAAGALTPFSLHKLTWIALKVLGMRSGCALVPDEPASPPACGLETGTRRTWGRPSGRWGSVP